MIAEINRKGTQIVWQTGYEDVYEQPVLVVPYHGSLSIEQDGNSIQLTLEYAEQLIKAIRKAKKIAEQE